jgi:hypothetical protein
MVTSPPPPNVLLGLLFQSLVGKFNSGYSQETGVRKLRTVMTRSLVGICVGWQGRRSRSEVVCGTVIGGGGGATLVTIEYRRDGLAHDHLPLYDSIRISCDDEESQASKCSNENRILKAAKRLRCVPPRSQPLAAPGQRGFGGGRRAENPQIRRTRKTEDL